MHAVPIAPYLTKPRAMNTLADAIASMATERYEQPDVQRSLASQHVEFYVIRVAANVVSELLERDCSSIALDELLNLDSELIRYALSEGSDRKHACRYATACRKILLHARCHGWACEASIRIESWQPIEAALRPRMEGCLQIIKYLIAEAKTPADTNEADLESWHRHAVANGLAPNLADQRIARFRGKMRIAGIESQFPLLDLQSKSRLRYGDSLGAMSPTINAELDKLVLFRSKAWVRDRDARLAVRRGAVHRMIQSFRLVHGCLTGMLGLERFPSLGEMITTKNLCDVIDYLVHHRLLLRDGVARTINPILTVARQHTMFEGLDCDVVSMRIKQVPKERKYKRLMRKEEKSVPYELLAKIPDNLQKRSETEGLTDVEVAWFLHDKAIISILLDLVFRQRNIRECGLAEPTGTNLIWRKINPKMLNDLHLPDCVREAFEKDSSQEFLMFSFDERETKAKRAVIEVVPLALAEVLSAHIKVRSLLVSPEIDPGSLFVNRHGAAMSEANLRNLVRRITRDYVGKKIPPHLWRDIYSVRFRVLAAVGTGLSFDRLQNRLWHAVPTTTEIYCQLDYALPGIAALNQEYRSLAPN